MKARAPAQSSGIEIFHDTGSKLEHVAFQPLGPVGAQGIVLLPHTRTLAVGLSDAGVAFLPLDEVLHGKAKVRVVPQGDRPGSGYLAATPDGQFLFVANEYGDGGNLGVIALHRGDAGDIDPEPLAHIRTPNATPGVAISPDGLRVYAVGEVVRPDVAQLLAGHGVPELEREGCVQGRADRAMPNGALYVIDVAKATALTSASTPQEIRASVVAAEDAGCSPVRESVSPDGATLYVTARGDNRVLVFDTKALETDRSHAFLRAIPTSGEAPVGLRVFNGGKSLLVANSNRFSGGSGNATLFDLSDGAKPLLKQKIKTGEFPRNITVSPDGTTLYLTIFSSNELMVLREKQP
ncbi:YncE family protein [Granulicella sp. S156]|uniref:YncE family protein n=1 Tax=Granulicella sp. S156 TaxID=1747224 RepID=UPI00131DF6D3|nr:YncE family protein [Granulicella sp. S156]